MVLELQSATANRKASNSPFGFVSAIFAINSRNLS